MVGLNTSLSSKIRNALVKSCARGLDGAAKEAPNRVFSLQNPYILEAIPDSFVGSKQFTELSKLEGMKLDEALAVIDSFERKAAAVVTNPLKTVNSKTDLYEELAKGYEKVANKRRQAGNASSERLFNDFAQKARNHEFPENDLYKKLYKQIYDDIRLYEYPITKSWNPKISEITGKGNNYMLVHEAEGWHFRIPQNRRAFGWSRNDKSVDRISVNANTDKELIAKLDEYFGTGKAKGQYKTPSVSADWLERHDPITIYLYESASPKILKDIENLTRPHIRSTKDVLVGHKFAPGLALERSPSANEIEKLLTEISNVNPVAGKAIREEMTSNLIRKALPKDSPLKASAGEMTALQRLLEMLK